ncbi:MAG TPA: alpha/beta hydrolase [Opitutaceae bacterium]|nr:alpha/beta hydrolase [Opitutaceae bacterium]
MTYQHHFEEGTSSSAPPLLLLHGTGGNELDLVRLAHTVSPGSTLISPRGDVNEHGQLRFFRRFAEGVFDLEDVKNRTTALAEFVREATAKYGIDQKRLIALGLSNGANIAAAMLQLYPGVLHGAVLLRAMLVLDAQPPHGSLDGTRILMSNGRFDPIVPADHPLRLASIFEAAGAAVTRRDQEASHGLVPSDVQVARDWLAALQS